MQKVVVFLIFFLVQLPAVAQQKHKNARFSQTSDSSEVHGKRLSNRNGTSNRVQSAEWPMDALLKRARYRSQQDKYGMAVRQYNSLLQKAREQKNPEMEAAALLGLGSVNNDFQKYIESIFDLHHALEIFSGLNNSRGKLQTTQLLSETYYNKSNFDSALYFARVSMQSAAMLEMNNEITRAQLNTIAALIRLKKFNEADKEIKLFCRTPVYESNWNLFARFHSLMGNYYFAKDEPNKSQLHYDSALYVAKAHSSRELLYVVYDHMKHSCLEKGDTKKYVEYQQQYDESVSLMNSGKKSETRLGSLENGLNTNTNMYKYEIRRLNSWNELKDLQLLQEAEENKLKEQLLKQGDEIRNNLERQNTLNNALLEKAKSLSDSLEKGNEHKSQQIAYQKMISSELDRQKTNILNRLTSLKDRTLILLAVLLLFIPFVILVFYQYKRQRKKNIIIEKQKDELQILMKEIHHRVKNNLQVISSLLDLQSQTIDDSRAFEAIKEGRNRVQSMALIHQNLYGERSVERIKVKDYISNLAQGLIDSYNVEPGTIKISTDIDDIDLDVDTIIPLGLILNELISNSLKYAFRKGQHGEISILLKEKDNSLLLRIKDNGQGFSAGADSPQSTLFGMKLIKAFALKLKAKLEMYNDEGACVTMQIHKYKPVSQTG